jgi:hypothetical protein
VKSENRQDHRPLPHFHAHKRGDFRPKIFFLQKKECSAQSAFSQIYKPEMTKLPAMDIVTIAFYAILFVLAFMIARIIMKIMRGY